MYIAFKWLFGLTFGMWITMCCLAALTKREMNFSEKGKKYEIWKRIEDFQREKLTRNTHVLDLKSRPLTLNIKNSTSTDFVKINIQMHTQKYGMVYLHCFMFVAGALVVSVYNSVDEIVIVFRKTQQGFANILTSDNSMLLQKHLKITAASINCYAIMVYQEGCAKLKQIAYNTKTLMLKILNWKMFHKPRVNLMLLKKLKEMGEERKSLAQLLLAVLQENKNVRMQYLLENIAKKRLVRHIEKSEKLIKENRSRYVSFQQLYLVTHQENTFLKCQIKKLTTDKEEAEKDLLELLNEVFKSKNKQLQSFCNRFIVKTKNSILNSDAKTEIQHFLMKSLDSSSQQRIEHPVFEVTKTNSWLRRSTHVTESIEDNSLVPLMTEAPKLRGLPGECVWTVKDKDGLIEKLYEYDYESDFDAGDTIRRIREYSVYHDKDCLLDLSSSTTFVTETRQRSWSHKSPCATLCDPVSNVRFLTGSEAFKKFMQGNENVVSLPMLPTPRLLTE